MHRLEKRTKKLHDNAESMGPRSSGHKSTIKKLKELDKKTAKKHPQLNVSLEKKYKAMVNISHGIGRSADGTIPAHLVTGVKKK